MYYVYICGIYRVFFILSVLNAMCINSTNHNSYQSNWMSTSIFNYLVSIFFRSFREFVCPNTWYLKWIWFVYYSMLYVYVLCDTKKSTEREVYIRWRMQCVRWYNMVVVKKRLGSWICMHVCSICIVWLNAVQCMPL